MNEDSGILKVEVYTANGALPIEDAKVTIYEKNGIDRKLITTLATDQNGRTPSVDLGSVNKDLSLSPNDDTPYKTYDIWVEHPEYFGKYYVDLPIFPGTISIQPVAMMPLEGEESSHYIEYIVDKEPENL